MDIVLYQAADAPEVLRLRDVTFNPMHLAAALPWQPCQQVESVTREGVTYVCREGPQILG